MADKTFTYKVKIETEDGIKEVEKTASTLDQLNEAVSDLNKELGKADIGSEEFKKLSKEVGKAEGALGKARNASKGLGDQLTAIPGPIGQVAQGVKGLGTAFKALIMNPVGAVLAAIALALTTLYKAFTSTKAGAETLERVMAGLGAVIDVLRDRVLKVGEALLKFFSGDFKGAVESFKESYKGIGDEMAEEFRIAQQATRTLQEVTDATRELSVARAEQNKEIAAAKLLINDETISYEDRIKALEDVAEAEKELLKQELALEKARLQAMETLAAQSDSDKETLDAIAAQRIKLAQLEQQSLRQEKQVFDQRKMLNDKRVADAKRVADEKKKAEETYFDFVQNINLQLIEDDRERAKAELEIAYNQQLAEIDLLQTSEKEKAELRTKVYTLYLRGLAKLDEEAEKERQARWEERYAEQQTEEQRLLDITRRRLDARIQLLEVKGPEELEQLKSLLDQRMEMELMNEELTEEEKMVIRKNYEREYKTAQENLTKFDMDQMNKKLQLAAAGAQALSGFLGEETAAGKAAASAQALINTYLGASQVVSDETVPSFLKPILIAGILAAGMKQVQNINKVETKDKYAMGGFVEGEGTTTSDSISARLSTGESVINARSTGMFYETLSLINELGGGKRFKGMNQTNASPTGNEAPIIKTYVVSSDVTSQQQLDRVIKSRSII